MSTPTSVLPTDPSYNPELSGENSSDISEEQEDAFRKWTAAMEQEGGMEEPNFQAFSGESADVIPFPIEAAATVGTAAALEAVDTIAQPSATRRDNIYNADGEAQRAASTNLENTARYHALAGDIDVSNITDAAIQSSSIEGVSRDGEQMQANTRQAINAAESISTKVANGESGKIEGANILESSLATASKAEADTKLACEALLYKSPGAEEKVGKAENSIEAAKEARNALLHASEFVSTEGEGRILVGRMLTAVQSIDTKLAELQDMLSTAKGETSETDAAEPASESDNNPSVVQNGAENSDTHVSAAEITGSNIRSINENQKKATEEAAKRATEQTGQGYEYPSELKAA